MIRELVKDEAFLSQPCESATAADADIAQDLLDTYPTLDEAAALAANQIGFAKCVILYLDEDDQPHIMFNPVMKRALDPFKAVETCLSRDENSKVTRFGRCTIFYDELVDGKLVPRKQEFKGWEAQLIQHTIDHCKGKLV